MYNRFVNDVANEVVYKLEHTELQAQDFMLINKRIVELSEQIERLKESIKEVRQEVASSEIRTANEVIRRFKI